MRLILLGPPGAGKGSQAKVLCEKFKTPHISTGDMFRDAYKKGSELGRMAHDRYWGHGALVPDDITIGLVRDRLSQNDCREAGFVLDGFPRTVPQAEGLEKIVGELGQRLDRVIYMKTSQEVILQRLGGRRVCKVCGANYHTINMAPRVDGVCDTCGGALHQRPDDTEETILNRLRVYEAQTAPLVSYYNGKNLLATVNSDTPVQGTYVQVLKVLGVQ
ncbi:MAG: adenylate kinase [Candidatus Aureabacteria bacterium]|nr:adenylate kinase [Candidatus Auribacterota bacterium]